jgi:hypothetical protein
MKLPSPSPRYEATREADRNRRIEQADLENHKRGRDLYVAPGRLLLTSPDGTVYEVKVDNTGALSAASI